MSEMKSDSELLHQYLKDGSEVAFAELVKRHLNLVYGTALRTVGGDSHLAQDITQNVFADLVRKAHSVKDYRTLAGWLHTSARLAACNVVRSEQRRQHREKEASMTLQESDHAEECNPEMLRPMVDEVVGQLNERDREAIVLRFFHGKNFREVGEVIGLNENSARMCVDRALDKLAALLKQKGVTSSASALSGFLLMEAGVTAPAGLAASITTSALSVPTTVGASLAFTKAKLWIAATVATALVTSIIVQQKNVKELRSANAILREQVEQLDQLKAENARLISAQIDTNELNRLREENKELFLLRGQVGVLRRQLENANAITARFRTPQETNVIRLLGGKQAWELNTYLASEQWTDMGTSTPENTLQTLWWARKTGNTNRIAEISVKSAVVSEAPANSQRSALTIRRTNVVPQTSASTNKVILTNSGTQRSIGSVTIARPGGIDYSIITGGTLALRRDHSARQVQLNVNLDWSNGRNSQMAHTFHLEDNEWKYVPSELLRPRPKETP